MTSVGELIIGQEDNWDDISEWENVAIPTIDIHDGVAFTEYVLRETVQPLPKSSDEQVRSE